LLIELLTASRRICQAAAIEGGRDGMKKEEVTSALAAQDRWGFTPRVSPCHLFLPNLRVDL
jgi:hypothetical protein